MSLWTRIANVFRLERLDRELDEEMQSHIDEAILHGRDPAEARRAFGSTLRRREESRDIKLAVWIESIRADAVFGWRQLIKNKAVSLAAVASLALVIGASTSAFRLIDAALFRPLPVSNPDRLYFLTYDFLDRDGKPDRGDSFEYPLFRDLRAAVKDHAELFAISYATRNNLTFSPGHEIERFSMQYVSGWMFASFGIKPALGRLLTAGDDLKPGAHAYAVLSYDYWQRRFGRDPTVIGRTFQLGEYLYEIVGVSQEGFTGTETGTLTDIFIPTMMNARAINSPGWSWFRTWVQLRPDCDYEQVRQKLQATLAGFRREQVKTWNHGTSKERLEEYVTAPVFLESSAAGVSGLQKNYRRPLAILAVIVTLVLLIACANVANLMTAQAGSRAREMALRVSIGAGRVRLVQLILVEGALIALISSVLGGIFAWWSAPFVVSMINPPDNPVRLIMPADWRVLGFAAMLAFVVVCLLGLAPALRASAVNPYSALKGGCDPHSRRRLMNGLVAAQVAFCFLVHFVAGLFVATFDRLANQSTGFSSDQLLLLETIGSGKQPVAYWQQVTQHLRAISGVQSAAVCGWPLMSNNGWSAEIWVGAHRPGRDNPYFLSVSPGWMETMRIAFMDGRDFRETDVYPDVAVVNHAFARRYFDGRNPVGKSFERIENKRRVTTRIIGYVADARYRNMRDPIRPTVYVPFHSRDNSGGLRSVDWGTFVVRTAAKNPLSMASLLRHRISQTRPELRVANIRSQDELVKQHTIRERLLAILSLFFAVVALVLAGVGLYGVLTYSVLQRRREIGIRLALGAPSADVARRVITEVLVMLGVGGFAGLIAGVASERYIETLLYAVKPNDFRMLALPAVTIFTATAFAALPPIIRAVRIDPAVTLRSE